MKQRALAATDATRYRWEVIHYENEAYRLVNLGTDVAHDVTMTVNYPDEWLLDLPRDATIAPHDWHKFRISPSLSPEVPDFVLISWREHPELMRVPLPLQT